ncbi:hypothetical protein BS47DRAFT_1400147 [Hydnum rufescens UP504]|uniref:Uncharacterized protein n=1 Tax=Hydnum rufescens UP504 TaxID=1448309 RepID=A0A9P6DNZ1_9AGAM|nr:hypothetical protein BS47DRAFT_1400147 [Hydnum rufescens UP504]
MNTKLRTTANFLNLDPPCLPSTLLEVLGGGSYAALNHGARIGIPTVVDLSAALALNVDFTLPASSGVLTNPRPLFLDGSPRFSSDARANLSFYSTSKFVPGGSKDPSKSKNIDVCALFSRRLDTSLYLGGCGEGRSRVPETTIAWISPAPMSKIKSNHILVRGNFVLSHN